MTLSRHPLAALALLGALAAAPHARAADACKLEISANDMMQYDKPSLAVPATCKQVTLTLHHSGKLPIEAMGHNWVLVNAADLTAVATAGMTAGLAADYLAPVAKRSLTHTKFIGGQGATYTPYSDPLPTAPPTHHT